VGYEVEGWVVIPPVIGEKVHILRTKRNGIEALGKLWTSAVTSIGKRGFCTQNSVYVLVEMQPSAGSE
jgi:hypothetical protein